MSKFDVEAIEKAFSMILKAIGEDCNRQGLQTTPKRIAKMYEEIFAGINVNVEDQIQVTFNEDYHEMVVRQNEASSFFELASAVYGSCVLHFRKKNANRV